MLRSKFLVSLVSFAACALDGMECPEGWSCVRPSKVAQYWSSGLRVTQSPGCPLGRDPNKTHCLVHGQCPTAGYDADMPHLFAAPTKKVTRRLLHVFLHGTNTRPEDYLRWLQASRDVGLYTIGLSYASSPFPDAAVSHFCDCASSSATECLNRYHHSALFGGNATPWHAEQEDSIERRLLGLLSYLAMFFPSDDWKSFMWDGDVVWGSSMWSGHSQGGAHVAYLLKVKTLFRAVLLSAPQDVYFQAEPAENASMSTPWSDVYGLVHSKETHADTIVQNWRSMALLGVHHGLASIDPAVAQTAAVGTLNLVANPLNVQPGDRLFLAAGETEEGCSCLSRRYHCSTARDNCELTVSQRSDFWEHLLCVDVLAPETTVASHSNGDRKLLLLMIAFFVAVAIILLSVALLLRCRRTGVSDEKFARFDDMQTDDSLRELGIACDSPGSHGPDVLGNSCV